MVLLGSGIFSINLGENYTTSFYLNVHWIINVFFSKSNWSIIVFIYKVSEFLNYYLFYSVGCNFEKAKSMTWYGWINSIENGDYK